MRKLTTKERGKYKMRIAKALLESNNIKDLILGDTSGKKQIEVIKDFKKHVKSHLFIDETIKETETFIFYDIAVPALRPQVKELRLIVYCICHRDILENYEKEDYYGNRADILSQMVEEILIDENIVKQFGIGDLTLDSVNIYNSTTFYGCIMDFSVHNFR